MMSGERIQYVANARRVMGLVPSAGQFLTLEWLASIVRDMPNRERSLTTGRGGVVVTPTDRGTVVVLRQYMRGGAVRFLLKDLFLRPLRVSWARPFRELALHFMLWERGCAVPQPLAAWVEWTRAGVWYRGGIVTRRVDGATTLSQVSRLDRSDTDLVELSRRAGQRARQIASLGVDHPDLHPDNVLVDDADNVWVIDFDRATWSARVPRLEYLESRWARYCRKYSLPKALESGFSEGLRV